MLVGSRKLTSERRLKDVKKVFFALKDGTHIVLLLSVCLSAQTLFENLTFGSSAIRDGYDDFVYEWTGHLGPKNVETTLSKKGIGNIRCCIII